MVAMLALVTSATLQAGALLERRAAEEELLRIGAEFRAALTSYANATPPGQRRYPSNLLDLLKDPRYPATVRHLRRIYIDPITGKAEWGLLKTADGGIVGIYSLSDAQPIKQGNFETAFKDLTGKSSYREWQFTVALPPAARAMPPHAGQ